MKEKKLIKEFNIHFYKKINETFNYKMFNVPKIKQY